MWNRPDYGPVAKIKAEKQRAVELQGDFNFFCTKTMYFCCYDSSFRWLTSITFFVYHMNHMDDVFLVSLGPTWFTLHDLSIWLKESFISVWPSADEGMVDVSDTVWQMTGRGFVKSRITHRLHPQHMWSETLKCVLHMNERVIWQQAAVLLYCVQWWSWFDQCHYVFY